MECLKDAEFAAYASCIFLILCFVLNIATFWVYIKRRYGSTVTAATGGNTGPSLFVEREKLIEKRFTFTAVFMFLGQFVMAVFMVLLFHNFFRI